MNEDYESGWKIFDLAWSIYEIRRAALEAQRNIIENQNEKAIKKLDQVFEIIDKWKTDAEVMHVWTQMREADRRIADMRLGKNILTMEEFMEKLERLGEDLDDPDEDKISDDDEPDFKG